jgi:hypothetical protein
MKWRVDIAGLCPQQCVIRKQDVRLAGCKLAELLNLIRDHGVEVLERALLLLI